MSKRKSRKKYINIKEQMLLDCLVDLTAPTGQAKRVRSSLSIYSKRRTRLFRKQKKKKKKKKSLHFEWRRVQWCVREYFSWIEEARCYWSSAPTGGRRIENEPFALIVVSREWKEKQVDSVEPPVLRNISPPSPIFSKGWRNIIVFYEEKRKKSSR